MPILDKIIPFSFARSAQNSINVFSIRLLIVVDGVLCFMNFPIFIKQCARCSARTVRELIKSRVKRLYLLNLHENRGHVLYTCKLCFIRNLFVFSFSLSLARSVFALALFATKQQENRKQKLLHWRSFYFYMSFWRWIFFLSFFFY